MKKFKVKMKDGLTFYENENGPEIGVYRAAVIERDGLIFKDLSGTGELLPYEDWRLSCEERAGDLADRLTVEEIAGLMLYSSHQMVPFYSGMPFSAHYGGQEFDPCKNEKWELTDEQKAFLAGGLRHVLLMCAESTEAAVKWSNELQKAAESLPWGIPVNISSDPRHGAGDSGAEFKSAGAAVSKWPEGIGMAAAGEKHWLNYARAVKAEYRALGITTALGPQTDLATEPRWMRYEDTFGGDLETSIKMAKIICDEMQTTHGSVGGWGKKSVAVMAKHWPGGGTGEGGRDAHYGFGKYAVFPGGNFEEHKKVFTEGALKLDGPTKRAASVMPYYTVSWGQDKKNNENVGNSYSGYIIRDLLREECGYDGVICTDWDITGDAGEDIDGFNSRCYGAEKLSTAQRHLRIIMNGVDQFGGNNDEKPLLEAYRIGCNEYGQDVMQARFRESAARLLTNMFRLGLFEDPYLDLEKSELTVGCPEFVKNGMEAQLASVVLMKNKNSCLPLKKGIKVFVPERTVKEGKNFFRMPEGKKTVVPLEKADGEQYFEWADKPEDADAAIVFIESPLSDPYHPDNRNAGGNGYFPISLQYRPYTASAARKHSIAGGDPREETADRSYFGKTNTTRNEADLDIILDTKKAIGDKPVIVCARVHNPFVVSELEHSADGILAEFGVCKKALLDIIFGNAAPTGKLPAIFPKNMETVETHNEDVFDDICPYEDELGNVYGFGYGLTY